MIDVKAITEFQAMDNPILKILWNRVEKSPKAFVKGYTGQGGFKGHSVAAQWRRQIATSLFGYYGQGWGLKDLKYSFENVTGKPEDTLYTLEGFFYYRMPITKEEFALIGGDPEATRIYILEGLFEISVDCWVYYKTSSGWRRKNEIRKVLATDATTKALSYLGFNSDLFYSLFDDPSYGRSDNDDIIDPTGKTGNDEPKKGKGIEFKLTPGNRLTALGYFNSGEDYNDVAQRLKVNGAWWGDEAEQWLRSVSLMSGKEMDAEIAKAQEEAGLGAAKYKKEAPKSNQKPTTKKGE